MLPSDLIKLKKNSQKIIVLTAWDSITGSLVEESGADIVLIGDSLAMVALGYQSTLPVTLENMIYHANAVSRGFKKDFKNQPLLVCDMPFLSYQCGEDKAVEFAGRIIQSTYAKAVKIEGAEEEIQSLAEYGKNIGIAYQIRDDLLDWKNEDKLFNLLIKKSSDPRDVFNKMDEMLKTFSHRAELSLRKIKESSAKNNLENLIKFTEFKA